MDTSARQAQRNVLTTLVNVIEKTVIDTLRINPDINVPQVQPYVATMNPINVFEKIMTVTKMPNETVTTGLVTESMIEIAAGT